MTADQSAEVEWRDGAIPVSRRFDDPYFSVHDGLAESGHVFLRGNGLPERLRPGFGIAELGFGTGLNLMAAAMAMRQAGVAGPVHFTSFEAFPLGVADMRLALSQFTIPEDLTAALLEAWAAGLRRFDLAGIAVEVIEGDARQTLPCWQGKADAWFLDGFSPAKNPELWGAGLMREVAAHTGPGGSFATYSAAGHIRHALAEAGFEVERVPGYGRKRHMTVGRLGGAA